MEIRQTSDKGMTIFKTPPAPSHSDEAREAEKLFSSIAAKHSLMSKGGRCEKERAKGSANQDFVIQKMYVPGESELCEPIVKDFKKEGHIVQSEAA